MKSYLSIDKWDFFMQLFQESCIGITKKTLQKNPISFFTTGWDFKYL
jgi:hypothetical protein